ncbi:MAG: hypothetical protein AB9835_01880 [Eubacteriales bacterium]
MGENIDIIRTRITDDIGKYVGSQENYVILLNDELHLNPKLNQTMLSRVLKSLGLTTRKGKIEKISSQANDKELLISLLNKNACGFIVIDDKMINIEIINGYGLTIKGLIKKIYSEEICGFYMDDDGNLLIITRKRINQTNIYKLIKKETKVININGNDL